jgi:hypothetical protein
MSETKTYALRLPRSLKETVERLSREEGTSINQFVATAVAEKVSALPPPRGFGSGSADLQCMVPGDPKGQRNCYTAAPFVVTPAKGMKCLGRKWGGIAGPPGQRQRQPAPADLSINTRLLSAGNLRFDCAVAFMGFDHFSG